MTDFIYDNDMRRRKRSPYLISLWSGYYSAFLAVSAFIFLNQKLQNSIVAFGALAFAAALGISLGALAGTILARRRLQMTRLALLLALASFLSGLPFACGDRLFADAPEAYGNIETMAPLVAGLLFSPALLLLSALPPYAAAIIIRCRGSVGSVDRTISLLTMLGYCAGALLTASYLTDWSNVAVPLRIMLFLSLALAIATFARHRPRKPRRS